MLKNFRVILALCLTASNVNDLSLNCTIALVVLEGLTPFEAIEKRRQVVRRIGPDRSSFPIRRCCQVIIKLGVKQVYIYCGEH